MESGQEIIHSSFQRHIREVLADVGERSVPLDPQVVQAYCELTGYDYALYSARDRVPPGFLMTFTASLFSEMFISFFVRFPDVIKGVIHTASKVELLGAFRLSCRQYQVRIEPRNIEEKAGKKGNYFAVDLEALVTDEDGGRVASDIHQFFLRI